jgi:hypothetical protein
VNENWQLVELHGCWWAYEGKLPPPEAFRTHGRRPDTPILGPYPSRAVAEALLRRHPPPRDPESRTRAGHSGRLRRVR